MVGDPGGGRCESAHPGRSTSGCSTRANDPRCKPVRPARRTPLHPQGGPRVEPGRGRAPGQDQARQLQRLARRARRRLRLLRLASTPTTCRCPTSASGCSATSATRTSPSSSARRCTATTTTSSPRPPSRQQFLFHSLHPAGRQPLGAPMFVGTNNAVRIAGAAADRRPARLDHRGHGHRPRAAPRTQPATGRALAVGLHPGRARRRRGPASWTDYFTQQTAGRAARTRCPAAVLAAPCHAAARARLFYVHADVVYYPMAARQLVPRRAELRPLPAGSAPGRPGRRRTSG